jgi:hypothetical protein
MNDIFDAYCGIYCGSCIIRLAYVQNRPESIPEPWKTASKGMDLEFARVPNQNTWIIVLRVGIIRVRKLPKEIHLTIIPTSRSLCNIDIC